MPISPSMKMAPELQMSLAMDTSHIQFARMPIAPELLDVMEGTNVDRRAHGYSVARGKSWNM